MVAELRCADILKGFSVARTTHGADRVGWEGVG